MSGISEYCLYVLDKGEWKKVLVEYYNPFTCFIFGESLCTVFRTFKQAQVMKDEINAWRSQDRLPSYLSSYSCIRICKIEETGWRRRGEDVRH